MAITYVPLLYVAKQLEMMEEGMEDIKQAFESDFIYTFMLSPLFRNPNFKSMIAQNSAFTVYSELNDMMLNDHLLEGVPGSPIKVGMTEEERKVEWLEEFSMSRICFKWAKNKIVYQLDSEFEKELLKTTGKVKIPFSMLEKLENKCFYIEFQEGTQFSDYHGFFVNVAEWKDRYIIACSRLRENEIYYHFLIAMGEETRGFGTEIYEENGEKGFIYNPEDMVTDLHNGNPNFVDSDYYNRNLARDNMLVLQFITYLCADNCEIKLSEESQRTYHPSKTVKNKYSEIRKYEVGFKLGKAIRTYRKRISSGEHASGYTVKPHLRAAHWHTYYKGKGKTEKVIHWLSEIFVHQELAE